MLLSSTIVGAIITLLTGLTTSRILEGATHYGYPLAWLIRLVIAPQHFPWRVNALYLVVDIIVWAVIIGIGQIVFARTKKAASP